MAFESRFRARLGVHGATQPHLNGRSIPLDMGKKRLRIADASIMPEITTGNTMAPGGVIGERAAEMIKTAHRI
jgi:GMC oxidoreductase